jgi:hypothetical protein
LGENKNPWTAFDGALVFELWEIKRQQKQKISHERKNKQRQKKDWTSAYAKVTMARGKGDQGAGGTNRPGSVIPRESGESMDIKSQEWTPHKRS